MNRILRRMKSTLKANLQMSYGMSALMRAVLLSAVLLSAFATAQAPIVTPTQPIGKPMRAASAPAANAKVIAMPAGLDFGVVAPRPRALVYRSVVLASQLALAPWRMRTTKQRSIKQLSSGRSFHSSFVSWLSM